MCVVVTEDGGVLIPSIKQPVFNSQDRPLKSIAAWVGSPEEEEEERKGAWNDSFSGKDFFSVDCFVCPS